MQKIKKLPSADFLHKLILYDAKTGEMRWRRRDKSLFKGEKADAQAKRWNTRYENTPALNINTHGYRAGRILYEQYFAHRVAFKMVHGYDPVIIDHIDGNRSNNAIRNLRSGSNSDNMKNGRMPRDNTSGVVGVCWSTKDRRWFAQIKSNGVYRFLGSFVQKEDAIAARKQAEKDLGFDPNHGTVRGSDA